MGPDERPLLGADACREYRQTLIERRVLVPRERCVPRRVWLDEPTFTLEGKPK